MVLTAMVDMAATEPIAAIRIIPILSIRLARDTVTGRRRSMQRQAIFQILCCSLITVQAAGTDAMMAVVGDGAEASIASRMGAHAVRIAEGAATEAAAAGNNPEPGVADPG
jgi:hypothetical protein